MEMEGMVHGMVGVHLVDQPNLHLVANPEVPIDRVVHAARRPVDEPPAHVRWCRHTVDRDHVIFPLDAPARWLPVALVRLQMSLMVSMGRGGHDAVRHRRLGYRAM